MVDYKLEEVVVMKPVRTGAMFTVGAVLGPIFLMAAAYLGYKLFDKLRLTVSEKYSAEEKPVSNLTVNAGVTQVEAVYSTLEGQAYGQTANDYMRATPVPSFGQNYGGRAF
jgi:hypothetical protein